MKNNNNSAVIMFVDDALAYGVEKGHYPEFPENKELRVVGLQEASEYGLSPQPNDVFVYNPFQLCYTKLAEDMHMKFLENKMLCYQKVLGFMGATKFRGEVAKVEEKKIQYNITANGGYEPIGAEIKGASEKTEKINKTLRIERDFETKTIKSEKEIQEYLSKYSLRSDSVIMNLFDEYKYQQGLKGSQSIETVLSSELNKSLDIALGLTFGNVFSLNSSFEKVQSERLEVIFKLEVKF